MEESKEPEKPESKIPEEEEPSRTEEDREVHLILSIKFSSDSFVNVGVSLCR